MKQSCCLWLHICPIHPPTLKKNTPECWSTINASDGGENISKLLQQTGSWCCQRRVWYPSLCLSASLSKCCLAADAAAGESSNETLFLGLNQPFSPASIMKSMVRTLRASQLLGGNPRGLGLCHLSVPIPLVSQKPNSLCACRQPNSPEGEGKVRQGKAGQC